MFISAASVLVSCVHRIERSLTPENLSSSRKNTHYVFLVLCCFCCSLQYTTGATMNGCKLCYSMNEIIATCSCDSLFLLMRKNCCKLSKKFIFVSSLSTSGGGIIFGARKTTAVAVSDGSSCSTS